MIETILKALLPVLPYVFVAILLFAGFTIVYLFRKFSSPDAEKTRQAVELEISLFSKIFRLGRRKTDPVVTQDPNVLTISRPIPAVPPPERKP